jgi:hypothetical protein
MTILYMRKALQLWAKHSDSLFPDLLKRLQDPKIFEEYGNFIPVGLEEDFWYLVFKFKAVFRLAMDRQRKLGRISAMLDQY